MRYYTNGGTLVIRGMFRAAGTGADPGIRDVTAILVRSTGTANGQSDPTREIRNAANCEGLFGDVTGVVTSAPIASTCILKYDGITAFVTAGPGSPPRHLGPRFTIVVCSSEGLGDAALYEAVTIATEAKAEALLAAEQDIPRPADDAIITASEGLVRHRAVGIHTAPGKGIREAVLFGVATALHATDRERPQDRPRLFVYSRYGGTRWIEWVPEGCPYYPCHFERQRCDFCYCPFYPCGDTDLGGWVESSHGGQVWNCSACTLLHRPNVAEYLKEYPDAPLAELKRLKK